MEHTPKLSDAKIAVVGLGYVGLPLAVEFGKYRNVIGFDINSERINDLNNKVDSTLEISSEDLLQSKKLSFTNDVDNISKCNVFIITVPTPIDKNNSPNLIPLRKASEMIAKILKKGDLVIYESTVYPGATEEVCVPILSDISNLEFNKDFFVGYSPERINPGDKENTLTTIKKITSGSTPEIASYVNELYLSIISAN